MAHGTQQGEESPTILSYHNTVPQAELSLHITRNTRYLRYSLQRRVKTVALPLPAPLDNELSPSWGKSICNVFGVAVSISTPPRSSRTSGKIILKLL